MLERVQYWLNGAVPLAYQLEDPDLLDKMDEYMQYILAHQVRRVMGRRGLRA